MKQTLSYGRVKWSYEEDDSSFPTRPTPLMTFCPIRINGKPHYPKFSDRTTLSLFRMKTEKRVSFKEGYIDWYCHSRKDHELSEGRDFLLWLIKMQLSIKFEKDDLNIHPYFTSSESPRHDENDEMAQGLSFAVRPVTVNERKVKLYLQDDAVLNLIGLPYGHEVDFLDLVRIYVKQRFLWEEWRAPAPTFLDWVKNQGQRPVFNKGQLGFCLA